MLRDICGFCINLNGQDHANIIRSEHFTDSQTPTHCMSKQPQQLHGGEHWSMKGARRGWGGEAVCARGLKSGLCPVSHTVFCNNAAVRSGYRRQAFTWILMLNQPVVDLLIWDSCPHCSLLHTLAENYTVTLGYMSQVFCFVYPPLPIFTHSISLQLVHCLYEL